MGIINDCWTEQKNIQIFITHDGLMDTQEAISCAIPMLGIPLFTDQFTNIDLCAKKKIPIRLNYHNLIEEKLNMTLNNILL